jgi:hypothetical protein
VGGLEFGGRDVAAGLEQPSVVNRSRYFRQAISTCSTVRHGPPGGRSRGGFCQQPGTRGRRTVVCLPELQRNRRRRPG